MRKKSFLLVLFLAAFALTFSACHKDDEKDEVVPVNHTPEPNPNPEPADEMPEYTVIYYGHGGGNLDACMLSNIYEFYQADPESLKKVKIAVQLKLSTAENLNTPGNLQEYVNVLSEMYGFSAEEKFKQLGSASLRFVLDPDMGCADIENADPSDSLLLKDDIILDKKNIDVGDPQNLTDFIKWAVENAPAKKYVIVLADHGSGYSPDYDAPSRSLSKGLIFDDGNFENGTNSHLTVFEIEQAVKDAGIHPEVLYLEACLLNTVEYWFQLKDLADYMMVSTFPSYEPCTTALIDGLAKYDVEKALTYMADASINKWDNFQNPDGSIVVQYGDISVIRTANIDAFGAVFKEFTDLLVDAYQNGGKSVKDKIDDITTNYAFKIDTQLPSYTLTNYAANIMDTLPEIFTNEFIERFEDAYEDVVIHAQVTKPLRDVDWNIGCSIMLGCQNHITFHQWLLPEEAAALGLSTDNCPTSENGYVMTKYFVLYADGTKTHYNGDGSVVESDTWGYTFDDTYKALRFDQLTGWSRWIEINEAEPVDISISGLKYNVSDWF